MDVDRLRWTGLAAVTTLWVTLSAASVVAGFDLLGRRPLSHLVSSPGAAELFGAGLAVAALLFLAFAAWLRARYPTSPSFTLAMVSGMVAQLVAAVVPIEGGGLLATRVHTVSALFLGAAIPVLMWRFAAAQPPGPLRRVTGRLAQAELAACVLGVWLSRGGVAPLAEIVPAAVFHAWVATLTLWPGRESGSVEVDGAELAELVEVVPGVDPAHGARLGAHHQ